jgi:hypothetical protein
MYTAQECKAEGCPCWDCGYHDDEACECEDEEDTDEGRTGAPDDGPFHA